MLKNLDNLLAAIMVSPGGAMVDFVGPQQSDSGFLTYPEFVGTLAKDMGSDINDLLHGAVGSSGEAGELLDVIKKMWVYGKEMDDATLHHIIEELGDLEFYMQIIRLKLCLTRERVLEANYEKLKVRYAEGYSDAAALARVDKVPQEDDRPNLRVVDMTKVNLTMDQIMAVDETAEIKPKTQTLEEIVKAAETQVWTETGVRLDSGGGVRVSAPAASDTLTAAPADSESPAQPSPSADRQE